MFETALEHAKRLRKHLPFGGVDGKGILSEEICRKILHEGVGGESKHGPIDELQRRATNDQIDKDILADRSSSGGKSIFRSRDYRGD